MSSRKGTSNAGNGAANSSPKGKDVAHSSSGSDVNQLSDNVTELSINSSQKDGDWEVFTKKPKSRTGAAKPWGPPTTTPKAWSSDTMQKLGTPSNGGTGRAAVGAWSSDTMQKLGTPGNGGAGRAVVGAWQAPNGGRGHVRPQSSVNPWAAAPTSRPVVPPPSQQGSPAVAPPLQHGWNWGARAGAPHPQVGGLQGRGNPGTPPQGYARQDFGPDGGDTHDPYDVDDEDDDDALAQDSDDDILSDGFDSDESVKSHGTRKQNKWFKAFFEALDSLTVDQLNETSRQWHCPACANGPGAIDWYRGLQPLMAHAKTKGARRVKMHREFAELLDSELILRGTSVIPSGESFGKWEGLRQTVSDHEIVWPPMVFIMNTKLEQDENDKWTGMGNQELLDYFSQYKAGKARHSYGPQGHRGISVLIFENSAMGYTEAERLHRHFAKQGTDRDAWNNRRTLFYPGGKRQLYGYMARKEDMDVFNQHSQGKTKLKFEMKSYQEMVVQPLKQMEENSQRVVDLHNKLERERNLKKQYEQSLGVVSKQLRQTKQENRVVRRRTKEQHEQNKEEMDYQEQFFKDQINTIHQALEEKERAFEERLQAERKKVEELGADSVGTAEHKFRVETFIQSQAKGVEEFEGKREEVIKQYQERKAVMRKRHLEEEVELEKEFKASLTNLMAKYAPELSEEGGSSH